jgi:hypothetical protein
MNKKEKIWIFFAAVLWMASLSWFIARVNPSDAAYSSAWRTPNGTQLWTDREVCAPMSYTQIMMKDEEPPDEDCDSPMEKGRLMLLNSNPVKIKVCTPSGWKSVFVNTP